VFEKIKQITGQAIHFIEGDIRDTSLLKSVLSDQVDAVMHFAGLKAVGESCELPVNYYDNNVGGTLSLVKAMAETGVHKLIFSSSATVYGNPHKLPIKEDFPLKAANPYGWSKMMIEQILKDLHAADKRWSICILRYFNPVGAHVSGLIGEDPNGIPNNLMPYISQVAAGRLKKLKVFGGDYNTPDGTGVRDYIHVVDLVLGHLAALKVHAEQPGLYIYNLGTGQGVSVLELRAAFEKISSKNIPFEIVERRAGDVAACWADSSLALKKLNWKATKTLDDMAQDTWRWQYKNPKGFSSN
jgi:UDP-glucose 4-epimerase